jgi:uncharacterized protein with HEPN domain
MKSEFGDKQRIKHIIDAGKKILLATENYDEEKFLNDFIVSAAVCNFVMIIGEAASTISKGFKETHTEFDWLLMKGMRNIIVHEYFGVDERKLWDTVMNDVPKLVTDSENALKDFE